MRHGNFKNRWEEALDDSDELFIASNSKHCALVSRPDGTTFLLRGDFSGTPEECEAEVRRIMNEND
jgi:hypothetical protein